MPRPLPTVIGPTENVLRALLTQTLSSTLIPGYPTWVVLNAMSAVEASSDWRHRASAGLRVAPDEIDRIVAELRHAELVDDEDVLTAAGTAEVETARAAVMGVSVRLVDGIDETDQETTRRVLDALRRKAEGLLIP